MNCQFSYVHVYILQIVLVILGVLQLLISNMGHKVLHVPHLTNYPSHDRAH